MAKSYYDLKEYDRCAFFTKDAKSPRVRFLHFYSKYLAGERKRVDSETDVIVSTEANFQYLKDLRADLQKYHETHVDNIDGYILYLYGVVLKKLGLNEEAKVRQFLYHTIILLIIFASGFCFSFFLFIIKDSPVIS